MFVFSVSNKRLRFQWKTHDLKLENYWKILEQTDDRGLCHTFYTQLFDYRLLRSAFSDLQLSGKSNSVFSEGRGCHFNLDQLIVRTSTFFLKLSLTSLIDTT